MLVLPAVPCLGWLSVGGCDLSSLEGESVLGQRLYDIETELSEQKRSTTKITKLCMSAINALERIEEKPGEEL